ncbi:MAG: hypothetical protein RL518_567 [Pseudomonadota bacterium]|jgi:hypothetical protein
MNDHKKPPQTEDHEGDENARTKGAISLLDKIRNTLANTAPERWEQGGEPLDSSRRFPRAQETWEEVFFTDTKSGTLVLRSSTPISNNYFGGGYSFTAAAPARFFIELRGRGWSPKSLLNPAFRGSGGIEKPTQLLAEGDIAEQLYREVELIVKQHRESLRRDFNDSVARLTATMKEAIGETTAADWQVVEGDVGVKGYRTEINSLTVTVACMKNDISTSYSMSISRFGLVWQCRDPFLMQEVFTLVDESVKTASLEHLGKVLDDML